MIEQGEVFDRTPEEKQCYPSDSEAVEGMGPISTHKGENLMPTDRGIALYRRRIRKVIRNLENDGTKPPQPLRHNGYSVRTYGQDTVLNLPPIKGQNDKAYLLKIGEAVMDMQFEHEDWCDENRDPEIIKRLKEIEAQGID